MFILKYKWIFLGFSGLFLGGSLFLIFLLGARLGIDFTGGTSLKVEYRNFPSRTDGSADLDFLKNNLEKNNFSIKEISLLGTAASNLSLLEIKLNGILPESRRTDLEKAWSFGQNPTYQAKQISENTVGPNLGKEFTQKAIWSIILVAVFIMLFVAYSFREVSYPVSSWKYGLITILTLAHDITIPTGLYLFLGEKYNYEIDSLFVVAILTIIGISISDTIVVFDRIRENLKRKLGSETFSEVVGKSLSQTFGRSLNTSLAVIIVLVSLFYFGPAATRGMTFVLTVGLIVGTYSSIFVAAPLLVLLERWQK